MAFIIMKSNLFCKCTYISIKFQTDLCQPGSKLKYMYILITGNSIEAS